MVIQRNHSCRANPALRYWSNGWTFW